MKQDISDDLVAWCERWLGAPPLNVLFEAGFLSKVVGLRLSDGRQVVVKMRPAHRRLSACFDVPRHVWSSGYPCPEPLAEPNRLGNFTVTAESYIAAGDELEHGADSPLLFAQALAWLISVAPAAKTLLMLDHSLPWVWWDHEQGGVWSAPDINVDMYADPKSDWLDKIAPRVRQRLEPAQRLSQVIGHADFETQNVLWKERRLHVVHD